MHWCNGRGMEMVLPVYIWPSNMRFCCVSSLNWQHQLCKNPRPNPDIKTLFTDHTCTPPNGALAPTPVTLPPAAVAKPTAYTPLGPHGVWKPFIYFVWFFLFSLFFLSILVTYTYILCYWWLMNIFFPFVLCSPFHQLQQPLMLMPWLVGWQMLLLLHLFKRLLLRHPPCLFHQIKVRTWL